MKIFYQRAYPIGAFLQEKIGFEIEATDETHFLTLIEGLKRMCDVAHDRLNPDYPLSEIDLKGKDEEPEPDPNPISGHLAAINSASNLAALNWFKALVDKEGEKYPELRTAFENKLQQLQ